MGHPCPIGCSTLAFGGMATGNGNGPGPHRDIVVIGASAGGLVALREIVGTLPRELPASLFVVMHSMPEHGSRLAEFLTRWGPLPAHIAVHGERIRPGQIYVAPSDNHLTLHRDFVRVTRGPKENGHRPAVDPLFRTAARMYGNRVVGVVLTGNLSCGTEGLLSVKAGGGVAVVQSDPEYPGMPQSAIQHVEVDHIVPLADISDAVQRLVTEPIPEQAEAEAGGPHTVPPQHSPIVCPACQGSMVESLDGGLLRFRCHVGRSGLRWAKDNVRWLVLGQPCSCHSEEVEAHPRRVQKDHRAHRWSATARSHDAALGRSGTYCFD